MTFNEAKEILKENGFLLEKFDKFNMFSKFDNNYFSNLFKVYKLDKFFTIKPDDVDVRLDGLKGPNFRIVSNENPGDKYLFRVGSKTIEQFVNYKKVNEIDFGDEYDIILILKHKLETGKSVNFINGEMVDYHMTEAKEILTENGYEILGEGKFGRVLAAGALALGLTAGNANAVEIKNPRDLRNYTEEQIQNLIKTADENEIDNENYYGYKIKNKSIVFKYNNWWLEIYPTKHIEGISDDIVCISLDIKSEDMIYISYKDGSRTEYIACGALGEKNHNYCKVSYDEFGKRTEFKQIKLQKIKDLTNYYYNLLVK